MSNGNSSPDAGVEAGPDTLRITEIFLSLQGESRTVGIPTVFVRLTGCPLRCGYCDTAYAFKGGTHRKLATITDQVREYGVSHVTVTGGEPLSQPNCLPLLEQLCDMGFKVSLETSGALDVAKVDPRVVRVMDVKTPGSGEVEANLYGNFACLAMQDQIKFVITDRQDYDWVKQMIAEHGLVKRCEILLSPVHGQLQASQLADWIVEDRLPVRFQLQLHKLLWNDEPGR